MKKKILVEVEVEIENVALNDKFLQALSLLPEESIAHIKGCVAGILLQNNLMSTDEVLQFINEEIFIAKKE